MSMIGNVFSTKKKRRNVWREINMTGKKKKKTIGLIYFLIN
jgi:hypothetical protein